MNLLEVGKLRNIRVLQLEKACAVSRFTYIELLLKAYYN